MRSGCLCWLLLVVVDIIRYEPPQMTGLPFSAAIPLGRSTTPSAVLAQPFSSCKRKRLFRMNLMHGNTDNISHVHILTLPVYVIAYVTWFAKCCDSIFFLLKSVSSASIWHQNIPFQTLMGNFKGEQILLKFVPYFNHRVLHEDSTTENMFVNIPWSQFHQQYCHIT